MYQNTNQVDDPLRAEIWRALVAQFHGVMPIPAGDAFAAVTGRRIQPTAITRRRNMDRLPWPRSAELDDGRRKLVPIHVLVDVLLQRRADAPRRSRGRPRKTAQPQVMPAGNTEGVHHG